MLNQIHFFVVDIGDDQIYYKDKVFLFPFFLSQILKASFLKKKEVLSFNSMVIYHPLIDSMFDDDYDDKFF